MIQIEGSFKILADYCVLLAFCHSHHQAVFFNAGIGDKDVDTSEIFYYFNIHIVCCFEVCRIRCVPFCLYAESCNLFFGLFTVFVNYEVGKCYITTLRCIFEGDSFSNSTSTACDERYLDF